MDSPSNISGWHIDHIYPRSEATNFPMDEILPQKTRAKTVASIGNLTLLAPRENISQGAKLPNDEVKQNKLAASLVFLNPLLVNEKLFWGGKENSDKKILEGLRRVQSEGLLPAIGAAPGQTHGAALLDRVWNADSVSARQATYFRLFASDILADLGIRFNDLDLS